MKIDLITNNAEKQSGFIYGNTNINDEYYTPTYAITPILRHLKPNSVVWCPFDTDQSNYVKMLRKNGHIVISTHIFDGFDFFEIEPPKCDYIISNPPFSMKAKVFNRLFSFNIPFAMLVGVVGIFESKERFTMFKNNTFEIMYFDKRISFFKDYADQKPSLNPPFSSVYICSKMLPEKIVFETLDKTALSF